MYFSKLRTEKRKVMKGIIIITIVFALVFIGCKTTKQPAQSPYTSDNTEQPKVFSVPETSTETLVKEEPKVVEENQLQFGRNR